MRQRDGMGSRGVERRGGRGEGGGGGVGRTQLLEATFYTYPIESVREEISTKRTFSNKSDNSK